MPSRAAVGYSVLCVAAVNCRAVSSQGEDLFALREVIREELHAA